MLHVLILSHRRMRLDARPYFLREIAGVWREQGLRVSETREPGERIDADVAVLHVDLTVVPAEHLETARRYRAAVNGSVTDISKRRISANVLRPGDRYDGPVIVKTDANCGGVGEDRVAARGPLHRRLARGLRRALPWSLRARMPSGEYRIFDSIDRVPALVWHNPDLVVERFLPERGDEGYRLRTWVFLGDRETHSVSYSAHPVVKSQNVVRREPLGEVPAELRKMRTDLGFDFGKFDYALVDGRVVLYDVNRTPTVGAFSRDEFMPRIRHLAEGIRAFA